MEGTGAGGRGAYPADILIEDCRHTMKLMRARSVTLVVTSPPYMVEKSYERNQSLDAYTKLLGDVYEGVRRILEPGGYFCVNFGDQARGRQLLGTQAFTTIPMAAYHWVLGRAAGLELVATRIWRKKFARMGIPFVCNRYPRHVFDYEHVWTWRKPGESGLEVVRDRKLSQRGVLEFDDDHPLGRFEAAFPLGLPEWAIRVYSDPGNLVYDPFLGSGTTALAAQRLGRRFIGSEINPEMRPIIEGLLEEAERE